tara:strand:- start:402 stop:566 length:165 start_codon:yes stop_codon:yes gene_type:complete
MRKKPLRRPVKKPRLRRRRLLEQKRRLASIGINDEQLKHLNTKEIRKSLRENGV